MTSQWDFLKKSFELGRFSHAYIFSGNDIEEQKKTVSNFIALVQCNEADIHSVIPDNEIIIAQVRELSLKLSLSPWASPLQIAVIENAHLMNQEAQSAFLKLLEDPRGDTVFFLLTEYPFLLFPTLRSRAQQIEFWRFASLQTPLAKEFEELQTLSLAERFEYAKDLAESDKNLASVLTELLKYLRSFLLTSLKNRSPEILQQARTIRSVQETLYLLQTTNVNKRLAIEQIMLAL